MLGLLSQSLKDETMAINPWTISSDGGGGESLLMLFVPHSITTFLNRSGKAVSLTQDKTYPMQSVWMPRLINLILKRSFHKLL